MEERRRAPLLVAGPAVPLQSTLYCTRHYRTCTTSRGEDMKLLIATNNGFVDVSLACTALSFHDGMGYKTGFLYLLSTTTSEAIAK